VVLAPFPCEERRMITVLVSFSPAPGKKDALVAWLASNQARVRACSGFGSIVLLTDERGVVEIETWTSAAAHRAMVDALDWSGLDALVTAEPEVRYLDSANEVLTTRVIPAPRARVFAACTDAETLARWWGPRGFTNSFEVFEPRPGGCWRFVMHGPDGRAFRNESVFCEVVAGERIAFDHVTGPIYHATIALADAGEGTAITWHMRFDNAAFLAQNRALIERSNEENLDKLEETLRGSQVRGSR
jgi:uncharacterized protein YndB with AHSA1/START domain/quinol monooxygenase YgiN